MILAPSLAKAISKTRPVSHFQEKEKAAILENLEIIGIKNSHFTAKSDLLRRKQSI